jgi:hypothetical protein
MSKSPANDQQLVAYIAENIGSRADWASWPGGWPGDIESALIDAVFSARAVYKSKRARGVHARVLDWRKARERTQFSVEALVAEIDHVGIPGWAQQFGNEQVSPGRPGSAPGGSLKAAAVREAALALSEAGISVASDLTIHRVEGARRALLDVPGIGYATSNYFFMLLGQPGVKPDRMIHRFLERATGCKFTNQEAERLLSNVAQDLGVPPHDLEHAIWRQESDRARR